MQPAAIAASFAPLRLAGGISYRRFHAVTSSLCLLLAIHVVFAAESRAGESAGKSESANATATEFFERKIRPVLVERCYSCHSTEAEEIHGGLLLDSRPSTREGGDSGAAVVPGDPEASLLMEAIRYESLEMPPDGKLPEAVIRDFEAWIRDGAHDPRTSPTALPTDARQGIDIEAGRQHWAFQLPREQTLPLVERADWPRRRIDWFVLAGMEAAGLSPSEPADRRTLIRRVSFDLTGLPPEPEDVEALIADPSPDAYARFVDRLLASPHYGERLARMWLDVARYAEDQAHIVGNDRSLCYPNAYLYRDWVIKALNEDLPYDQFLRLQLAADLIEPTNKDQQAALGFLGLGPKYYARRDPAVQADEWEDRVDVVSRGLMGLTVACARCHDHKFDPIPTTDYYALAGVFASTEMFNRPLDDRREVKDDGQAKQPDDAVHIVREGKPTDLPVFIRGNVENKGSVVERHFPQVLCPDEPTPLTSGSGRRQLADAIAHRENPLTARVIVNRVWALNFGVPLVATPSNFGTTGASPSHPALLDDLAVRFMQHGWSLKWLEREIVLSATYQQSSRVDAAKIEADPENRWLARMRRRRLSVEGWRDAVLAISGRLDRSLGGPSMDPLSPGEARRTIYSEVSRLELNRMLALFDFPDPNMHAGRRIETTTPLQKLFVLNNPFMTRQAASLAERLLAGAESYAQGRMAIAEPSAAERERIERAYQIVFARPPSERELELGLSFLFQPGSEPAQGSSRWEQYCHVLLASNELLFVD